MSNEKRTSFYKGTKYDVVVSGISGEESLQVVIRLAGDEKDRVVAEGTVNDIRFQGKDSLLVHGYKAAANAGLICC